jgi:hypothetical protein
MSHPIFEKNGLKIFLRYYCFKKTGFPSCKEKIGITVGANNTSVKSRRDSTLLSVG